jgi:hypothetical protein
MLYIPTFVTSCSKKAAIKRGSPARPARPGRIERLGPESEYRQSILIHFNPF